MFYLLILALFLTWFTQMLWKKRRQIALTRILKTNLKSYPIIGLAWMLIGTNEDRMNSFKSFGMDAIENGGLSASCYLYEVFVCVADPEVADIVTKRCLVKHRLMNILHFLIGNGSIFAPVPIWRPRRKILTQIFSLNHLTQFTDVFAKQSSIMADIIQKEVGKGVFSFWEYIQSYSLDSICENTFGTELGSQGNNKQPLLVAIDELIHVAAVRLCQPWLWNNSSFRLRFTSGYKAAYSTTMSFLDFHLTQSENRRRFTETELIEEAILLVIAGSDTSATSAAFTVLMLARYPDVQEKVYQELLEVFGDSDLPVSAKDLARLRYMEAVIKESLRLYPPAPVVVRQVDQDLTLPSGVTLVKGVGIILNIWAINRNPKYWEDADQFRPKRFLEPLKHPAAFVSFSYGPRNCIGGQYGMNSMKTVLATMLRKYRMLPPPGTDPSLPIPTKIDIMMRPVNGFHIIIELRNKNV